MTFALVRAGLPNSVAVLALAMTPIVAILLAPAEPSRRHPPTAGITINAAATASLAAECAIFD
jgi:hypothetical protein